MSVWDVFLLITASSLFLSSVMLFFIKYKINSILINQFLLLIFLFSFLQLIIFTVVDQFNIVPEFIKNLASLLFSVVIITIPPVIYNYVNLNINIKRKPEKKIFRLSYILFAVNLISFLYFLFKPKADDFLFEVIENVMNYSNFISYIFIFPSISFYYIYKIIKCLIENKEPKFKINWKSKNHYKFIALGYFTFIFLYLLSKNTENIFFSFIYKAQSISYFILIFTQIINFLKFEGEEMQTNSQENQLLQKKYSEISEKLNAIIITDKPYLDSNITVLQLAKMIDSNEKYVSNYLNEIHNLNFYNYINQFRISKAKELLVDPQYENYTIESIGNMSGFKSKSSFNSAFKKETGLTPSEYKKSIKV